MFLRTKDNTENEQRNWVGHRLRIAVLGLQERAITPPVPFLQVDDFRIDFLSVSSNECLDSYDVAVVVQGVFESLEWEQNVMGNRCVVQTDSQGIARRLNEIRILSGNDGIVCVLVDQPIIDRWGYEDARHTDLAKRLLIFNGFERNHIEHPITPVDVKESPFKSFLARYGAAHNWFRFSSDSLPTFELAALNDKITSFVYENVIALSLLDLSGIKGQKDFWRNLARAMRVYRAGTTGLEPPWLQQIIFEDEAERRNEIVREKEKLNSLRKDLDEVLEWKLLLTTSGNELVKWIARFLRERLNLLVDQVETFVEDLTINDEHGKCLALCEVKGVSKGVQMDHVNQIVAHRARRELAISTQGVLFVNSFNKSNCTLEEKMSDIHPDVVQHAKRQNVLILRTVDVINLLNLIHRKAAEPKEIGDALLSQNGWLRADSDKWTIV